MVIFDLHIPRGRSAHPGPTWLAACLIVALSATMGWAQSDRVVITNQPGYSIVWDGNNGGFFNPEPGAGPTNNAALASNGTVAFGSSEVNLNVHFIANVNDGLYGNSSSWIPDFINGDTNAFIGLSFGKSVSIQSIAWGRDNGDTTEPACGGTCTDRAVGTYTLQVTTVANPDAGTTETGNAATGWATIGTVTYLPGADTRNFSAYLRHRFDVSLNGQPIAATGLRIKVSDATMDIDEIEVNPGPDPIPPLSTFLVITSSSGYTVAWDGNDGLLSNPAAPAPAPRNLASTATAFGSSEFGQGAHLIASVNDGLYGNSHSWIADFTRPDTNAYIGLKFPSAIQLKTIAWSRDNGDSTESACGGTCTDRALGKYTLQVTRVADPGAATLDTGDATTGWATVATLEYKAAGQPFTPYLRHRYDVATSDGSPITVTGVRLLVPDANTAIDEIEINVNAGVEQNLVLLTASQGYSISWDGNDGDFYNPSAGARAPNNEALAANGGVAFGSSELGFGIHFFSKVNDGYYGNSSSWISKNGLGGSEDPDPFIGVRLAQRTDISSIAWSRDNGDTTEGGCGGTCLDRCVGVYTLQVTTVANPGVDTVETGDPASGWVTIGTVEYVSAAAPSFNPSRRHRFDVATNGKAIPATALRIKVSTGDLALDEIEINPANVEIIPPITDLLAISASPGFTINWDGNDGEHNDPGTTAAPPENLALATKGTTAFGSSEYGHGVHFFGNVIDGRYGNAQSWISDFTVPDANPYVGLRLPKATAIRTVAWGRDNGNNSEGPANPNTDRALGTYTLQITRVANPGTSTVEAADPAQGWVTVGTLQYKAGFATLFNPHLRHRYSVGEGGSPAILATGLRIKVSDPNLAIDEIEINPIITPDQNILVVTAEPEYAITWDGNDGDYNRPDVGAAAPNNAALAKNGSKAFGSTEIGQGVHFITNIIDGLYGNSHCWISDFSMPDPEPFVGVAFGKTVSIETIAWGRDNGDNSEGPSNPNTDRAAGTYTLQFTTVAEPGVDTQETGDAASGWATIGTVQYRGTGSTSLHHYLRHSYGVSRNGSPIPATALRIKVSDPGIAIDEVEVNSEFAVPAQAPRLTVTRDANQITITWTGQGVLESSADLKAPWTTVSTTGNTYTTQPTGTQMFYRVKQ